MRKLRWLWTLAVWLSVAKAGEVRVAVAANFASPMQKITQAFEKETGHKVVLSFGSTGVFYVQIKSGAPFEVLVAADQDTPLKLEQEGHGVMGTRATYAIGKLVLWSKQAGYVDEQGLVLRSQSFKHLAIANPQLAPYGVAAIETLKNLKLLKTVQPRLVQGDNIAQTFQFVSTENANLGFVAMSQVYLDGQLTQGSAWIVPDNLYAPIRQDMVMLNKGLNNPAAEALIAYMRTQTAKLVMRSHGYAF